LNNRAWEERQHDTHHHRATAALTGIGILALLAHGMSGAGSGSSPGGPSPTAAERNPPALATLSRPPDVSGRTLGLPKDGKDLYIPDEDYIRISAAARRPKLMLTWTP